MGYTYRVGSCGVCEVGSAWVYKDATSWLEPPAVRAFWRLPCILEPSTHADMRPFWREFTPAWVARYHGFMMPKEPRQLEDVLSSPARISQWETVWLSGNQQQVHPPHQ